VWDNRVDYMTVQPGDGALSEDPRFVNDRGGDYHLEDDSPCIDAGDPAVPFEDPDGTRNDMGAYGGPQPFPD